MILKKHRRKGPNFARKRTRLDDEKIKSNIIWGAQILSVILLAFLCVFSFGIRTNVVGQAMADTLSNGDEVLINRLAYVVSAPKSNDVIVFLPNGNERSHYYIRRVIAVPGDTILIKNGVVYINGIMHDEKIEVVSMDEAGVAYKEITLGEDEFFVLGDNRNNSEDSRYANIGNIKREYIIGKAWLKIKGESGKGFIH